MSTYSIPNHAGQSHPPDQSSRVVRSGHSKQAGQSLRPLVPANPQGTSPLTLEDHQSYEFIDFDSIEGTACPCGSARRALMDSQGVPYSLHLTKISNAARVHYHKRITETYVFLDCDSDAQIELDGTKLSVSPRQAVVIYPGTRHRAIGNMTVIIIASPKFDPDDEWFD